MDYKQRLQELVTAETAKNDAEQHRKKSFEGQQRAAFDKIREPLAQVLEAAGPTISRKLTSESFANITISGPGSQQTTYDIEPNSNGKYSSSPSPAPGYCIRRVTTYVNVLVHIEPTEREYVLKDADALLEDLMKHIAEAIGKKDS